MAHASTAILEAPDSGVAPFRPRRARTSAHPAVTAVAGSAPAPVLPAISQAARPAAPAAAPHLDADSARLVMEVAHDLRSPLASILLLADTLQSGQSGAVNDLQRRQLGLIYSAALGLSELASDAIDLARDGRRMIDAEPAPFSLVEVLESVRGTVRLMAEEKGLDLRVTPAARDQRLGHGAALSRVLLNLTTNALKFTDAGYVEVSARAAAGADAVEFAVRDTGRGMSPEVAGRLCEPWRPAIRDGRARYVFSGTGLGLAISRRLIEAMGGALGVETRPGWGTRFSFTLRLPGAAD